MGDCLCLYQGSLGFRQAGEQIERLGAPGGFVGLAFGVVPLLFPTGILAHLLGRPLFAPRDGIVTLLGLWAGICGRKCLS